MALFLTGEYRHQVDEKMRIRIPAKFKEALGESPFITAGPDGALIVMPYLDAVEQMEAAFGDIKLSSQSASPEHLKEARLLASSGFRAVEDNQGRIVLPSALIKHGKIQKDIITIGMHKRLEIWSTENWENYLSPKKDTDNAKKK